MNPEKVKSLDQKVTPIARHAGKHVRKGYWRISKDLRTSFYYAFQGITYGFLSQRNFRIQLVIGAMAIGLGVLLGLQLEQLTIIIFAIALVLVLELINTAIEAAVDLAIGQRFHPLARIAKDCAAGAVLVASASSLIIASLLVLPALLSRIGF